MTHRTHSPKKFSHWYEHQLIRFHWLVIIFAFIACTGTAYYVYHHLSVNTNTSEMISPDLPFQKNQRRLEKAFPDEASTTLFVIDGTSPEEAMQSADELLAILRSKNDTFESAYIPTDNAFFRQQALLYLELNDLQDLAKKLISAQPFIGYLAQHYSINGLFELITKAINEKQNDLPMDLNPLLSALNENLNAQLNGVDQKLSWQNLLANTKLSNNAQRVLLIAKPKLHFDEMLPADAAQAASHQAAETIMAKYPQTRIRITGETALEHEELESVTNGAQLAGIASFILVFVVQWIGFHSFRLLLITYIVLVMGLIFTAGFAGITVGHLNVISIAFASLYIGLGVDYAVHICLYYRERKARGYSNADAIHHSMKGVGSSLFLCALTAALGFFAFIPTDYSGVSELGIISGGGIFIGLLISISVLPALLCALPVNNPKPIRSKRVPKFIVTFPFHYAKSIRITSIVLAVGSAVILTDLSFDANTINLRDPNSESVSAIKELLRSNTDSPFAVYGLASSLENAEILANKMRSLSTVHDAITLSSFVAENQEEKLAIIDDLNLILGSQLEQFDAHLPDSHQQRNALEELNNALKIAIANKTTNASMAILVKLQTTIESYLRYAEEHSPDLVYVKLEKNILALLPYTLERLRLSLSATAFDIHDIPNEIRSHWVNQEGDIYKVMITPEKDQNIDANLQEFVADVQGIDEQVSGLPIANEASGDAVVNAFLEAFGGAFLAITVLLWGIYRKFNHMLLVIAPLLLAALLTGATNVLLNNPFNFANIIALPLLLGMGIDSSILIMHKLHFNFNENEDLLNSSTTRGIIFSSITTLCSFSSLSFTHHQGMASMGLLLSIGLFFTVVCSLIVLPAWSGKRI